MPAKELKAYTNALNNASLLAQRDLEKLWLKIREYPPGYIRDALIALVPGIIAKYGSMAALAGAEYFEAERAAAGGNPNYTAQLADGIPIQQIEASVRFACGHLFPEVDDGIRLGADDSLFGRQG